MLPADARALIEEEERLLARVRERLRAAGPPPPRAGEAEVRGALVELREEAQCASDDDLAQILGEMNVRQRLAERERYIEGPRPDPMCPYLAHLRLREGERAKDYLLGQATFIDLDAQIRIVDWRVAPIAQIFYRYREGDEYEEEFPGRIAEGLVEARRILVIARGQLERIVTDRLALERAPDATWVVSSREALSMAPGGAGTAARAGSLGVGVGQSGRAASTAITALLDAEQYAAISAPAEEPLLVLGSAGSGKTTVALHRLARITTVAPETYPLSDVRVVVPEEGLARLCRRLLEPLGAGATQVKTLDVWSTELAREVFSSPLRLCTDPPAGVSSLKRHPALYRTLRSRMSGIESGMGLPPLRRRLTNLLSDRTFLSAVVEASGGELLRGAVEETVRHTMLQTAEPLERQLASITDEERKQALDDRPLWEDTPDALAGTLDLEDLPILLCMRAWNGRLKGRPISHLVLDEAEDFSLFDLHVLGKLQGRHVSVTLAGDESQQTASSFAGWEASLAELGAGHATTCRLAVSYRCPRPVAELAHRLLGPEGPPPLRIAREGAPIGFFPFPTQGQAHLFLAGALADLVDREPRASIAVIASEAEAARRFFPLLSDIPEARLVLTGEFSFEPGIDVIDVDNAKGLEFDYVVVLDATGEAYPMTAEARRRLYVAVTRASHQLWLIAGGTVSPLLREIAPPAFET